MFCSNGKQRKSWTRKYNFRKRHKHHEDEIFHFILEKIKSCMEKRYNPLKHHRIIYRDVDITESKITDVFIDCYGNVITELFVTNQDVSDEKVESFKSTYGSSDVLHCLKLAESYDVRNIHDKLNHLVFSTLMKNLLIFLDDIKFDTNYSEQLKKLGNRNKEIIDEFKKNQTELREASMREASMREASMRSISSEDERPSHQSENAYKRSMSGGKYSKRCKTRRRRCKKSRRV